MAIATRNSDEPTTNCFHPVGKLLTVRTNRWIANTFPIIVFCYINDNSYIYYIFLTFTYPFAPSSNYICNEIYIDFVLFDTCGVEFLLTNWNMACVA